MSKLKLGINEGISNAEYHADRLYLSSSVLKTILKNPAEYEKFYIRGAPKPPPTNQAALDEGSLAHSLILEPHLVASEYQFFPGLMKKGREWEEFKANADPKKPIISEAQKQKLARMIKSYEKRPEAVSLIKDASYEFTLCVELQGVPIKVRFDATKTEEGIISDVKTTGYSGEYESFKETVKGLEYDLSAALYVMAAEEYFKRPFDFYFIVLSKLDSTCNVYKTSKETLEKGRRKVIAALETYKKCKKSGIWLAGTPSAPAIGPYEVLEV